jgi:hypothetical protein
MQKIRAMFENQAPAQRAKPWIGANKLVDTTRN